jgi:WD40 repeat protein
MTPAPSSIGMPDTTATFTPGLFPGMTQTATLAGASQAITSANAHLVAQPGLLGKGSVVKAEWSPEGHWVAVASTLGIHIHRAQPLEETRFIDTTFAPNTFDLSPDGKVLAVLVSSLHSGEVAQFWSVPDGSKLNEWPNLEPETMERVLPFSPDGSLLYSFPGEIGVVESVAFSPEGSLLAAGALNKTVFLWSVSDGTRLNKLEAYTGLITDIVFSKSGTLLASSSDDGTIRLWGIPNPS